MLSTVVNYINYSNFQRLTVRKREVEKEVGELSPREILRERIAKRAALEFNDGMYGILAKTFRVNLNLCVCTCTFIGGCDITVQFP